MSICSEVPDVQVGQSLELPILKNVKALNTVISDTALPCGNDSL
jgi:hypothetical protein